MQSHPYRISFLLYIEITDLGTERREVIADCVLNNKLGEEGAGGLELLQKTSEYLKQRP